MEALIGTMYLERVPVALIGAEPRQDLQDVVGSFEGKSIMIQP